MTKTINLETHNNYQEVLKTDKGGVILGRRTHGMRWNENHENYQAAWDTGWTDTG